MKTYNLIVIAAGSRVSNHADAKVKGFVEAEKKADELLEKYIHEYPSDTYVVCVEDESEMYWDDYLCRCENADGGCFWAKMQQGTFCPIGLRMLTDDEQEELDLLYEEKEIHIYDLDEFQLKKLRNEISIGSVYYSDYCNSFDIDEDEVMRYSESYDDYINESNLEDTPEEFADYILSVAV